MERKEIVHTLVHNDIYYFELPPRERLLLIKHLEQKLSLIQSFKDRAWDWVKRGKI